MLKFRKLFFIALSLYLFSILIKYPFTHIGPFGRELTISIGYFDVMLSSGFYMGLLSFILLLVSIVLLYKSLRRHSSLFVIGAFIFAILFPSWSTSFYERNMAQGISSFHYKFKESLCEFDVPEFPNNRIMSGECELIIENMGNQDVSFTLEFEEGRNYRVVPYMNQGGPYQFDIKANETKTIYIETTIDVPEGENALIGGVQGPVLIVRSDGKVRELG